MTNSSLDSGCDLISKVSFSDPDVLIAVERFNLRVFKSIVFLEYQMPVDGSKERECDVSWRFRNKKEKSWRKYREFRRFELGFGENCTYKVANAKVWHSGVNAQRQRNRFNATRSDKGNRISTRFHDDETNNTIPIVGSDAIFTKGKYLFYSRGGDYCKEMNHFLWSFLCGLLEFLPSFGIGPLKLFLFQISKQVL